MSHVLLHISRSLGNLSTGNINGEVVIWQLLPVAVVTGGHCCGLLSSRNVV